MPTINAARRDFYIRGKAATLTHDKLLSADHLILSITGLDADLTLQRQWLNYGRIFISDEPVTFLYNRRLSAETGTFSIGTPDTGLALALGVLAASGGTLTISGEADLRKLLYYTMGADPGSVSLSLLDATLTYYEWLNATSTVTLGVEFLTPGFNIQTYTN